VTFPSSSSTSSSWSGSSRTRTWLRAERSEQSVSRHCGRIRLMSTWYSVPVGKRSGLSKLPGGVGLIGTGPAFSITEASFRLLL
jgi:hypothetical protein